MKRFAALFEALDSTTRTNEKVAHLVDYFREAPAADAAWAVYVLTGRRLRRLVKTGDLRIWAAEAAELPLWLVEESYERVGDLAETIALVVPPASGSLDEPLHRMVATRLEPLRALDPDGQRRLLHETWRGLAGTERLVWNKLITGAFRVGVQRTLVARALGQVANVDPAVMAHRLTGDWLPTADDFRRLVAAAADEGPRDPAQPYPFYLASPLEAEAETLGDIDDWLVEWKWDGFRAQLIRRGDTVLVWSRGEELMTDRFPEVAELGRALPDGTVVDGEVLAWRDGAPLPFNVLQTRITRKKVTPKLQADAPVTFMAFDVLELEGEDVRARSLRERRRGLESLGEAGVRVSEALRLSSWSEAAALRESARERATEGLMVKRWDSPYRDGRKKGDWWKWKVDPLTMDAVLVYAQRGHGRRAGLYTDYTFAVWDGDALVPVAKAYSGLTNAEIAEVDRFVRRNTREKHGPVRVVEPELVFELHFDSIAESSRHKSGIAVRFPRMARWRRDKGPAAADRIETLRALVAL